MAVSPRFLWKLFQGQKGRCALSGLRISFEEKTASLDRKDSSLGYLKTNVQWVHKDVNLMKNHFSDERFREICYLVCQHTKSS